MSTLSSFVAACRIALALRAIGLADRVLPTHYERTFFALIDLVEAIVEDRAAELEERR